MPSKMSGGVGTDDAARLRTAVGRLARRLRRTAAGELTQTQVSALVTLQAGGPMRMSELAGREGIAASTISRLIDSLEASGRLVQRTADPHDARACRVAISVGGAAVLEDLRRNGTRLIDQALESLGRPDREALAAALPVLERLVLSVEAVSDERLKLFKEGTHGETP
ncbi:MAG: MarR family winged helix-turn-helix transcriptional regulator [Candidatus Dormibacteria bacterium]